MNSQRSEINKYLLGATLVLALLIGGGTARGLYTDSLVVCVSLLSAAIVMGSNSEQRASTSAALFVASVILLFLIQLVPLPYGFLSALRPDLFDRPDGADPAFSFISLDVGATLESLLLIVGPLAFFLSVLRLRPEQVKGLLPFFFLGVLCNLVVAALQYSLRKDTIIEGWLPFSIQAGLFANVNHFSTLLFVAIPLLVYFGLYRGQLLVGAIGLASILLLLLAASSRAGVLIGLIITVVSLFLLPGRSRLTMVSLIGAMVGLSVYGAGALSKIDTENLDPDFGRLEFARTTLEGIQENWPLGVGFGNFVKAYQIYEKPDMIFRQFVNHAHNDYLEIVIEGGILSAVLILIYLFMIAQIALSKGVDVIQRAAFIAIIFILIHSTVDYPLRTLGLSTTFAFLNGILFYGGLRRRSRGKTFLEVESNGKKLLVPMAREGRIGLRA